MFPMTGSRISEDRNSRQQSYNPSKSHLINEKEKYVVYDPKDGSNELENNKPFFIGNKLIRKVKDTHQEKKSGFFKKDMFVDHEFPITNEQVRDLDLDGGPVVLKRLIHLYPKKHRFSFFPSDAIEGEKSSGNYTKGRPFRVDSRKAEFFLAQIDLFPPEHYRSFFLTQDYDQQGRYLMVVDYEGRFVTEVVDDYVPVYEKTDEPVWTRDLQNPWLMILLKVWAKMKKGYHHLPTAQPMEFLKTFTNSNWRYYNLSKEPHFLERFRHSENAKIVLKSKVNNAVLEQGIAPNQLAYELLSIHGQSSNQRGSRISQTKSKKEKLVALIRSTVPCQWKGAFCFADKDVNQVLKARQNENANLVLERTFFMNQQDFYNLFASSYVTSKRTHAVSDYFIINVPAYTKRAIHLEFNFKKDGFIDFSIQQPLSNKRRPNESSQLKEQQSSSRNRKGHKSKYLDEEKVERFQKCRYMLIKNEKNQDKSSDSSSERERQRQRQFRQGQEMQQPYQRGASSFQEFKTQFENSFDPLDYYCIEPEYLKGYNSGEGHFLNLDKGKYIFRFRPENSDKDNTYIFNYASNQYIKIKEAEPSDQERNQILRQSLISISDRITSVHLQKKKNLQRIAFGNEFQDIGYAFVSVSSDKINTKLIKLQVDPEEVKKSGYLLKSPFKGKTEPFAIVVNPGQSSAIVLKKIKDFGEYVWPPKGVAILEK